MMESLVKNHPFVDGNKRTSIMAASIFLQRYSLKASQKKLVAFTLALATKKIDFDKAVEWFGEHSRPRRRNKGKDEGNTCGMPITSSPNYKPSQEQNY